MNNKVYIVFSFGDFVEVIGSSLSLATAEEIFNEEVENVKKDFPDWEEVRADIPNYFGIENPKDRGECYCVFLDESDLS